MATRTQEQNGATALKHVDRIHIKSNTNIRDDPELCGLFPKIIQRLLLCGYSYSRGRSYNYVRENSLETNNSYENCCTCFGCNESCCTPFDSATVSYFDMSPFVLWPCCGCNKGDPNFRVVEPGCMCLCIKCSHEAGCCCCPEKLAVITPCDTCCCCLTNYATDCGNCCGCIGTITGNPSCYVPVYPQPETDEDVEIYVASAAKALDAFHGREVAQA